LVLSQVMHDVKEKYCLGETINSGGIQTIPKTRQVNFTL